MDRDLGVLLPRDLPAERVLPFARRADELGFDELWVVEDLGFRGGLAQAAAVLAATARVRVGIGVLPAAARSAAFTAMEAATLAELFPGRVHVGLGHGMPAWMRQAGSWPARPLTALGEHLDALRALLRGEEVSAHGEAVRLDGVRLQSPPALVPPVLAGVRGPRSLALAGRRADGVVLAEPATPEYVRAALAQAAPAGPFRVVGYDVAAVDDDEAAALERVRPALAWVGEPDWAPHLEPLDIAGELAAVRAGVDGPDAFARALSAEQVRRLAVAGTPAQARAAVAARHDAGTSCVVLAPAGPDPLAALGDLARLLPAAAPAPR
ncbi:LLM class flavin-dependent oxidoreductase [Kineococcus terrestris]|uniref:LLM class flavin-dependent oxidoreductase n=1 Tax=Kineococcus terrestris TaxID=2044856 RepID=UPI0034DB692F